MLNYNEIDFNEVWLETMGWNDSYKNQRKFSDEIESIFWKKLASRYTVEYNLNNDTDKIANKLYELLGKNNNILEIGCGTGNFTILMAEYSKEILGIDFSSDMLFELEKKLLNKTNVNIELLQSKWEDYSDKKQYDYIVSVNSLYRISDIKNALIKMNEIAIKGVILIRTIQQPFLADLYDNCNLKYQKCLDYELLPIILWKMGILAQVEFVHYRRKKIYNSLSKIKQEIIKDFEKITPYAQYIYDTNKNLLNDGLKNYIEIIDNKYVLSMPRITAFIYWKK